MNNDENSIGINGQTATSSEKSFVGSAEVQERILNDYTMARLRDLMFFHNETTLPYLINKEDSPYTKLKGHKWMPVAFMEEEEEENPLTEEETNTPPNSIQNTLENPFL